MKIDGIVVLYNPEDNVYYHIMNFYPHLNKLFVMDNSTKEDKELINKVKKLEKVQYVSLNGNQGIAKALKEGMLLAIKDNPDYVLTMDQDSIFPSDKVKEIEGYLSKNNGEYALISLNYKDVDAELDNKFEGIKEVKTWITSGNYISTEAYKKIKGFREELFIDFVDYDLDEQFYTAGYKIGVIGEIYLIHKLGNATRVKFLWKRPIVDNHPLIRYYYMYRNSTYLYKQNKEFYKEVVKGLKKQKRTQLLFSKERFARLKMINKGIKDGKKGILGPYKEK